MEEVEKPTNYFCHLKSRNFLNNTIKKVEVPEKGVIFNQFDILANCNETLYKNLDSELYDVGYPINIQTFDIYRNYLHFFLIFYSNSLTLLQKWSI